MESTAKPNSTEVKTAVDGKTTSTNDVDKDHDVLDVMADESNMSHEDSDGNVVVTIGKIIWPSALGQVNKMTESNQSMATENLTNEVDQSGNKPSEKKNVSGAEKKRRRKAKMALANSKPTPANDGMENLGANKRERSPVVGENFTPPSKRVLNKTPTDSRRAEPFKEAVKDSLVRFIVGANGVVLRAGQVELVLSNIIWELEKLIGSGRRAPSFNGKKVGESELELRCADVRTVKWLNDVVPRLKPWKNAALIIITMSEWEAINRPGRMMRMSVIVQWRTSGKYFMDVLRSNNPELRTKYWEIKNIQNRGDSTKLHLKVDEVSADLLRSWNYKAHWLLDVAEFRLERGNGVPGNVERERQDANKASASSAGESRGEGSGSASREDCQMETGTGAETSKSPEEEGKVTNPANSGSGKRGTSPEGVRLQTVPSQPATERSKVFELKEKKVKPVNSSSVQKGASRDSSRSKTGTLKPLTGRNEVRKPMNGSSATNEHISPGNSGNVPS